MPSKWPAVETPIPGREAFSRTEPQAILSQAAVLLILGAQARRDEDAFGAGAASAGVAGLAEFWPEEDFALFERPRQGAPVGRVDVQRLREGLARYGDWIFPDKPRSADALRSGIAAALPDLGQRAYNQETPDASAELMEACLNHPEELVRVASAASYFGMSTESQRLTDILATGCRSEDDLVRTVAATALWYASPNHVVLNSLRASAPRTASASGDTTLLVHGTWAGRVPGSTSPNPLWWEPGGDFHTHILQNVKPDLYSKPDRFGWSGDYYDGARALAGTQLTTWVNAHNDQGLDLITHSHGGSVAMLATHQSLTVGQLVLLSCPVHIPKYLPDFTRIGKGTVSIRVHIDLVILADRGGQKFKLSPSQIRENVLPVWFNHFATHDPATWNKYGVKSML
jgi:hypothetical protein